MQHSNPIQNPDHVTSPQLDFGPMQSILLFMVPGFLLLLSFYPFRRWLISMGIGPFDALIVSIVLPLSLLIPASFIGYYLEKKSNPNLVFRERFRYGKFKANYIIQAFGIFILVNIGYGILIPVSDVLIDNLGIKTPSDTSPLFSPEAIISIDVFEDFVGKPLYHNWRFLALMLIMLFANIIGEELWWRGYILPRQEAKFGKRAWIIHGLLWNIFHIFKWWDLLSLLPVTLVIAYFAQKKQENWTALLTHTTFNAMSILILLPVVLGF